MVIKHHGIKEQKWGVRNGPPYPLQRETLKKGTKVYTSGLEKRVYNGKSKVGLGNFGVSKDKGQFTNKTLKLKQDVNLPSKEDVIQAYKKAVESLDKKHRAWIEKEMSWEREYRRVEFRDEDYGKRKSKYETILDYVTNTSAAFYVKDELKKGGFGGMYLSSAEPYIRIFN